MEEKEFRRTDGSCVISEEVISSIASAAAVEVPGVAGMAQRPADIRGIIGSAAARAVRVLNNDSETVLDVYINLKRGAAQREGGCAVHDRQAGNQGKCACGGPQSGRR